MVWYSSFCVLLRSCSIVVAVFITHFFLSLEYDVSSQAERTPPVRQRHFYTESQLEQLEADFAVQQFPNQERRRRLAAQIGVSDRSILVCFKKYIFPCVLTLYVYSFIIF